MKQLARADQDKLRKAKLCQFKQQRVFSKPKVNFEAVMYLDVISWESQAIYEPPLTQKMTDSELKDFIASPLDLAIVSHSVQTERTIRDVNSVAAKSTSSQVRDGMIRSITADRRSKPKLKTKANMIS